MFYNEMGKVEITRLTREDFDDNREILQKYFTVNCRSLDRFHIPELTEVQHAEETYDLMLNSKKAIPCEWMDLHKAPLRHIRKMRIQAVAKDLHVSPYDIDTREYFWDERWYVNRDFMDNFYTIENWFRIYKEDDRVKDAYAAYITEDPRCARLDMDLYDKLFEFCMLAVRKRRAMMFGKVDKCLNFLKSIAEYTYGFSMNPTVGQVATMKAYMEHFNKLLQDTEFQAWVQTNDDTTVFANNELTHGDFIRTYRAMLAGLACGGAENMEAVQSMSYLLDDCQDEYTTEILNNNCII